MQQHDVCNRERERERERKKKKIKTRKLENILMRKHLTTDSKHTVRKKREKKTLFN